VDDDGGCHDRQRQTRQTLGQLLGHAVREGVHQVVDRADAADPEPSHEPTLVTRDAGPDEAGRHRDRADDQE
jgi:hypothetical protein